MQETAWPLTLAQLGGLMLTRVVRGMTLDAPTLETILILLCPRNCGIIVRALEIRRYRP